MTDWRILFAEKDWAGIEDIWPHLSREEQAGLLQALQDHVPKIIVTEGMERLERHVLPKEAEDEWKGAAQILTLGELEAAVEGEPPMAIETWAEISGVAREFLSEAAGEPGQQKPGTAGELSREEHSRKALELLDAIDTSSSWMLGEIDNAEDAAWLSEVIAEIAAHAFVAGRHMQEAWGKPFEVHALRGLKTINAAAEGAQKRKGHVSAEARAVLKEMQFLINKGHSVSHAADLVKQKGFGSSAAANRKLYQRYK